MASIIKYKEEVLGRGIAVQFKVGKGKVARAYKGKVRRVQISKEDEDAALEVLHEVVFNDGEEHWLDLAEVEQQGRLEWLDAGGKEKTSTTVPVTTAASASDESEEEHKHSSDGEDPKPQPTKTARKDKTKPIRVSLNKAKLARRQILNVLVASSNSAVQVVTPATAEKKKSNSKRPKRKSPPKKSSKKPAKKQKREYDPNAPVWVEEMFDWMVSVGTDGKGSTEKSALRIRKEILKLATGQGITHRQWSEKGIKNFFEGIEVDLKFDMDELWRQSQHFQDLFGKDPSHGWLFQGPITKLKAYKDYRIQNGIKLD